MPIPWYYIPTTHSHGWEWPHRRSAIIAKQALLAAFGEEADLDPECAVVDLLADLRHLCDCIGLDYANCDRIGYGHYTEEKGEWNAD